MYACMDGLHGKRGESGRGGGTGVQGASVCIEGVGGGARGDG